MSTTNSVSGPTIETLNAATVQANEDFLVSFLSSEFPSLDLTAGRVLRELLIRPAAIFYTLNNTNITNLQNSMSMLAVTENPTLATPEVVAAILSNYRLTPSQGATASGKISIILDRLLTTSVEQDTIFRANGLNFITQNSYVGVTDASAVTSAQTILIYQQSDGTFAFTIPVVAETVGNQYWARQGTVFTATPIPAGMVSAVAANDFTGGITPATNEQMIEMFQQALSPQVLASRVSSEALLRTFATINSLSIIGLGDPEMLRDRHNIFATSTGGKADIYVKTNFYPVLTPVIKTATLLDPVTGMWQIGITRDDSPGFYLIQSINQASAPAGSTSLEIVAEIRSLDLTSVDGVFVPDIKNNVEGAYSRYQTAVVQFIDPCMDYAGLAVGAQASYTVDFLTLPSIATLQDNANIRSTRNPQADYLVRAAIPAFVTIGLTVQYLDGQTAPSASAIKQAIVNQIALLDFSYGVLPASMVHEAVYAATAGINSVSVSPIEFYCQIRKPDGTFITNRSTDGVVLPDLPVDDVTSRTTAFFVSVDSIDVTVEKLPALPV